MKILYLLLLSLAIYTTSQAQSKGEANTVETLDSYGDAFTNYQPLVVNPKETKDLAPKPTAQTPKPQEKKVDAKWLQENYVLLETKVFNDPTKENAEAYAYMRRIVMDKSQRMGNAVDEAVRDDPLLNENNRVPYSSSGSISIRNANIQAQQDAVREMSEVGGLLVFVDGSCRFCAMQMPIIDILSKKYGTKVLVISLDGIAPKGYAGTTVKDNGLYGKLQLKLTPSIVYVHKPKGYTNGADLNKYYTVSQGYYALDELTKMVSYAGFKSKLLSAQVQKDLDIWNRGVASVDDLNKLTLDANNPASFKQKIQPLLLQRY